MPHHNLNFETTQGLKNTSKVTKHFLDEIDICPNVICNVFQNTLFVSLTVSGRALASDTL